MSHTTMHPMDAELLGYLDRELPDDAARRVEDHLEECQECQHAIDSFSAGTSAVEDALRGLTIPRIEEPSVRRPVPAPRLSIIPRECHPAPWYTRTSARVAMIIGVIGAGTLAVTPVRAWVVDLIKNIQSNASAPSNTSDATLDTPASENAASVAIVPQTAVFQISVARLQQSGVLTILANDGRRAQGRIVGGNPDDALLVTGTGFQIHNTAQSESSYEVRLPESIRVVVIRVGNRAPMRITRDQIVRTGEVAVPLVTASPNPGTNRP